MTARDLAQQLSISSAALARMRAVAVDDWEAIHGHPHEPCPLGCPIRAKAEQAAEEIKQKIQPPPYQDSYLPEVLTELFRPHGGH